MKITLHSMTRAGSLALSMLTLAACDEPDAIDGEDEAAPSQRAADLAEMPAPVGLWHLDEDCTSTVVLDDSATAAHGQRFGGATCVAGKTDRAVGLDGVDDRVEISDRPAFHFTTQMTAAAWVRPTATGGFRAIVNKWFTMDAYGLAIVDGRYNFSVALPNGGWGATHDVSAPAVAGAWAHVAGVYDGQRISLYVDGALAATKLISNEPRALQDSARPLVIGNHPSWSAFAGQIDEVRLYDVALAPAQVKSLTRNVYYVAKSGSDSNPGTKARPFRTPYKGAKVATVGDTVHVRGGVYMLGTAADGPKVDLYGSGTADERIVFRAYAGEQAVLDGDDEPNPEWPLIHVIGQYYDIVGFELRNAAKTAISLYQDGAGPGPGGRHVRILNNVIHHSRKGAVYPDDDSEDMHFEGNDVHHNVTENADGTLYCHNGRWPSIVNMTRRDDVVIGNQIHENWGEGIGAYGSNHRVAENVLHDNFSVDIYVNNIEGSVIERNFIYSDASALTFQRYYYPDGVGCTEADPEDCECSTLGKVRSPAIGIALANEDPNATRLRDNAVVDNIILGARRTGIQLTAWGTPDAEFFSGPADMQNTIIAHNTVVGAAQSEVFRVRGYAGTSDALKGMVKNNIFQQLDPTRPVAQVKQAVDIEFAANNWFGGNGAAFPLGTSPTDRTTAPLFIDPSGTTPDDYMLSASSPNIDAGATIPLVGLIQRVKDALAADFAEVPRPVGAGVDIGAHEFTP